MKNEVKYIKRHIDSVLESWAESEYGVRMSLENFSTYDKIKVLPLYAAERLVMLPDIR